MKHLNTFDLCAQQGIQYEPLVFTAQGGMERHAEAVLTKISTAVAKNEDASPAEVKAEFVQEISVSLMRSAAKSVLRRRFRPSASTRATDRSRIEAQVLQEDVFQDR